MMIYEKLIIFMRHLQHGYCAIKLLSVKLRIYISKNAPLNFKINSPILLLCQRIKSFNKDLIRRYFNFLNAYSFTDYSLRRAVF